MLTDSVNMEHMKNAIVTHNDNCILKLKKGLT